MFHFVFVLELPPKCKEKGEKGCKISERREKIQRKKRCRKLARKMQIKDVTKRRRKKRKEKRKKRT